MKIDSKSMEYYFTDTAKNHQMPEIVYHYCSLQTFLDICTHSTIRLSNITKSNDEDEIKYIIPFLEKAILLAVKDYNALTTDEYRITNESVAESIEHSFNELSVTFFVACFSEVVDLVDQWARYADHARGIAIGFSTDEFVKLQTASYIGYVFSSIVYDANHVINRMVEIITNAYERNCKPNDNSHNFIAMTDVLHKLIRTILRHAPLYKHPGFSQEREWRLIYNPFGRVTGIPDKFSYFDRINESNTYGSSVFGIKRNKIQYRTIEDGKQLSSYIDLNFDIIKKDLIREIIIGNQSKLTPSDMDLTSFLKSKGYNISISGLNNTIKISKSTIPYNK